jgi:hypothetical protein
MLKRVSDWTSDTTVPTAKPEQSRSRDQRLTSVRSQGWLIRSKRSLVRGLGLPALMVSPGSLSSRQVSRGYSASQPVPSCSTSTTSRAKARNAG